MSVYLCSEKRVEINISKKLTANEDKKNTAIFRAKF